MVEWMHAWMDGKTKMKCHQWKLPSPKTKQKLHNERERTKKWSNNNIMHTWFTSFCVHSTRISMNYYECVDIWCECVYVFQYTCSIKIQLNFWADDSTRSQQQQQQQMWENWIVSARASSQRIRTQRQKKKEKKKKKSRNRIVSRANNVTRRAYFYRNIVCWVKKKTSIQVVMTFCLNLSKFKRRVRNKYAYRHSHSRTVRRLYNVYRHGEYTSIRR